ncbi:cytochrome P450 [Syncephalis fuscata]|nr:cytochrome P450 [Syncephalis fuscata]
MQQAVDYLGLSTRDYNSQTVLLSATLIAIVAFILSDLFGAKQHDKGPPKVKYWIPVVGHGLNFIINRNRFFMECKKKYGDVYSILIFGRWMTIIGRSEQRDVASAPSEQLSFKEAVNYVMALDTVYVFGDKAPHDRFHIAILRKHLAKQLQNLQSRMVVKTAQAFKDTVGDVRKPYYMNNPDTFIHEVIGKSVATCLFENESLHNDPEVLRMLSTIFKDLDLVSRLKITFPTKISRWLTRRLTSYEENNKLADHVIVPEIQRRRNMKTKQGADYIPLHDMLEWIAFAEDQNGNLYSANIVAHRTLEIAFSSVSTTSVNTLHLMFDIASYPDIRKKLKQEQDEIISRHGENITTDATKDMKLLDACVRESLRVNATSQTVRLAMVDIQLKSGYIIPKGSFCVADGREINIAEDLYGPNSTVFNPYHHINADNSVITKASTITDAFTIFGAGQYACPGRFLAVMIMKSVIAYALRHYDFSTMSGKRPVNTPYNGMIYLPIIEPIVFKTL